MKEEPDKTEESEINDEITDKKNNDSIISSLEPLIEEGYKKDEVI